jgi:DNA-binding MarR family transcriptional regulator
LLSDLFYSSVFFLTLDVFLENPEDLMNLREIARRINKTPSSVLGIMPRLVEKNYITRTKVGKRTIIYRLNQHNRIMKLLLELLEKVNAAN